jgi:hypothetical protein
LPRGWQQSACRPLSGLAQRIFLSPSGSILNSRDEVEAYLTKRGKHLCKPTGYEAADIFRAVKSCGRQCGGGCDCFVLKPPPFMMTTDRNCRRRALRVAVNPRAKAMLTDRLARIPPPLTAVQVSYSCPQVVVDPPRILLLTDEEEEEEEMETAAEMTDFGGIEVKPGDLKPPGEAKAQLLSDVTAAMDNAPQQSSIVSSMVIPIMAKKAAEKENAINEPLSDGHRKKKKKRESSAAGAEDGPPEAKRRRGRRPSQRCSNGECGRRRPHLVGTYNSDSLNFLTKLQDQTLARKLSEMLK